MSHRQQNASLKLILPSALEEQVIDHLLRHPEGVGPFLAYRADGHGRPGSIASSGEQVRGRAERVVVEILLDADRAPDLVAHLKAELPNADIAWWITPVLASGDFSS